MINHVILVVVGASLLTACGIKRPLIAPRDIPAYEQKRQERLDKLQEGTQPASTAPTPAI